MEDLYPANPGSTSTVVGIGKDIWVQYTVIGVTKDISPKLLISFGGWYSKNNHFACGHNQHDVKKSFIITLVLYLVSAGVSFGC